MSELAYIIDAEELFNKAAASDRVRWGRPGLYNFEPALILGGAGMGAGGAVQQNKY